MNRTLILLRRELLSTFVSPVSWIILVLFLLVMGANMYISIVAVGGDLRQLLSSAYGGLVFWFMFLVIPPLVTMRSLAEEHRQGALEVLMETGISDASVVIAKWAASSIFYFTLWLCLLPLWGVLSLVGEVEPGLLFTTYVGIFFIGSAFCAIGILASALTAHPLAAAGFLAHAAKATRIYSLRQSNLPSDFLFRIFRFRWFRMGLQMTVRFCDWRQGHDLLGRGCAHGILQIPKEFQWSPRGASCDHARGGSLSVRSSSRNPPFPQGFIRVCQ